MCVYDHGMYTIQQRKQAFSQMIGYVLADHDITMHYLRILGTHCSASLCRDGQKTKWQLRCKYNADISPGGQFYASRSALWRCPNSTVVDCSKTLLK